MRTQKGRNGSRYAIWPKALKKLAKLSTAPISHRQQILHQLKVALTSAITEETLSLEPISDCTVKARPCLFGITMQLAELRTPLTKGDDLEAGSSGATMSDLEPMASALQLLGLWRPGAGTWWSRTVLTCRVLCWSIAGAALMFWYTLGLHRIEDRGEDGQLSVLVPGRLFVGPVTAVLAPLVVSQIFIWFLAPDDDNASGQPSDEMKSAGAAGSELLLLPAATGSFSSLLAASPRHRVRDRGRLSFRWAAALILVSATAFSVIMPIARWYITDGFTDRPPPTELWWLCPVLLVSGLCLWPLWFAPLAMFALSILLQYDLLEQHASRAHVFVTKSLDTGFSGTRSLDQIVRERFALKALIDKSCERLAYIVLAVLLVGSAIIYGFLFRGLADDTLDVGYLVISAITAGLVVCVLGACAWLSTADDKLVSVLLELRGRFPCEAADWALRVKPVRDDLDSVLSYAQATPIGFTVAGLRITPGLVKTILYAVFSGIVVVVQHRGKIL
jgi:hypothetical protein